MSTPSISQSSPTVIDPKLAKAKEEIIKLATERLPDPLGLEYQRAIMAHVHWFLINALESVWERVEQCTGDEITFAGYALCVLHQIENHHQLEEETFFPYLSAKGVQGLEDNFEEHKLMRDQVLSLQTYLTPFSTSSSLSPVNKLDLLDATKLHSLLQPFFETIVPHLRNELNTLAPERLEGTLTKKDFKEINAIVEGKLKAHDPHTFLPVGIANIQPGMDFPPFPAILRKILVPGVFKRRHASWWKYGWYPSAVNFW